MIPLLITLIAGLYEDLTSGTAALTGWKEKLPENRPVKYPRREKSDTRSRRGRIDCPR